MLYAIDIAYQKESIIYYAMAHNTLTAIVFGAKNRSANAIVHKQSMLHANDIAYQKELLYAML